MNYTPGTRSQIAAGEIRALLGRNRQTIKELAEATSIPLSTLNRRLLGRSSFTIDELEIIADHFKVSVSDIIRRNDATAVAS